MPRFPSPIQLVLAVVLALVVSSLPAEAGKKRKKDKKPATEQSASPDQVARDADALLWAYDTDGARQALEPVAGDASAVVGLMRARVLEQEKAYGEAAAELEACADKAAGDPAPLVFLGETYLHANDMSAATSAFASAEARAKSVLASSPADPKALYYLGVAQQRQKKYSEAVETLQRAQREDPGNALVVYQLGLTRAFQEDWAAAVDLLTDAIEMDSGIAYAYYYRGLAASKAGRNDLLINDLDRFLAMAPDAPEAPRARRIRDSG